MVILHVGDITTNKTNGVNVIVPKHIQYQSEIEQVAFVNTNNIDISNVVQLKYEGFENFPLYLAEPFNKPDLVVFHGVNYFEYIKIYKSLIKNNIPYIIFPHGELTKTALRKKWLKKKVAYLLFFNKFIKNATAIQCLSERELLNTKVKCKQKFISTNGTSIPQAYKQNFSNNCLKLVYIGRLEIKIKGLDLLIKAISKIKNFMIENNCTLEIYGPDYKGRFNAVQKLIDKYKVGKVVTLNEAIFDEEKINKLLESDLFIQTSRTEGMPLGIIEALSYGIPCVLTKGTVLMEDVAKNNCGYPAGDNYETIASAIIEAVKDRANWEQKSQNAVKYIENNYKWENIAQNNINKFKEILSK